MKSLILLLVLLSVSSSLLADPLARMLYDERDHYGASYNYCTDKMESNIPEMFPDSKKIRNVGIYTAEDIKIIKTAIKKFHYQKHMYVKKVDHEYAVCDRGYNDLSAFWRSTKIFDIK